VPLSQALSHIKGWRNGGFSLLDPKIVETLEPDDYTNTDFSKGSKTIYLYIGYYLTTKKIGSAYDPLVCFPGQGWVLCNIKKEKLILNPGIAKSISYSTMLAKRGLQKELIIYWFQSYDQTNPGTFSQKIASPWRKFANQREDNAFVRISTAGGEKSLSECRETIFSFIRAFYPVLLGYIKDEGA
jgi:EpsI family protein